MGKRYIIIAAKPVQRKRNRGKRRTLASLALPRRVGMGMVLAHHQVSHLVKTSCFVALSFKQIIRYPVFNTGLSTTGVYGCVWYCFNFLLFETQEVSECILSLMSYLD